MIHGCQSIARPQGRGDICTLRAATSPRRRPTWRGRPPGDDAGDDACDHARSTPEPSGGLQARTVDRGAVDSSSSRPASCRATAKGGRARAQIYSANDQRRPLAVLAPVAAVAPRALGAVLAAPRLLRILAGLSAIERMAHGADARDDGCQRAKGPEGLLMRLLTRGLVAAVRRTGRHGRWGRRNERGVTFPVAASVHRGRRGGGGRAARAPDARRQRRRPARRALAAAFAACRQDLTAGRERLERLVLRLRCCRRQGHGVGKVAGACLDLHAQLAHGRRARPRWAACRRRRTGDHARGGLQHLLLHVVVEDAGRHRGEAVGPAHVVARRIVA
mmetsp:Transcript_143275/g.457772  ORF Transcript_143275/g.457772 Transcript_143275/m.457772 type:complete len:333 (+) Transcript_143275:134-1132(+)